MITINFRHIQIPVLAMGRGWLVVDKPAGLTVHNAAGRDLCSLAFARIQKEAILREQLDMDSEFSVNPVHRLDKETSGIILLAGSRESFRFLSNQFESRQVKKKYIAILHGRLEKPEEADPWGTWGWPLSETAGGRQNPEGPGNRKDCLTRYRILDHSSHYTMVEIELLTGRTHQIRRHAKLSGHPVVGDARYGSMRAINYLKRNFAFDRLGLHAHSLTLQLPGGKTPETIETPAIPNQMLDLFQNDPSVHLP
ncbi:MAG: RNA pseudouridine synthase [Deltaproteobacteria bacterium]|nr:RNA pseudouridine synthase [Deltaproteobacteria bacterium]